MAKKFACGDVVDGCAWSATAKDDAELFQKISAHARDVRKMSSIPDEIMQKVRSKIKDA